MALVKSNARTPNHCAGIAEQLECGCIITKLDADVRQDPVGLVLDLAQSILAK